jgi:hypothetical protein
MATDSNYVIVMAKWTEGTHLWLDITRVTEPIDSVWQLKTDRTKLFFLTRNKKE